MFSTQVLGVIGSAGWTMWLMIAASVVAIAIIGERFYSLRKTAVIPEAQFEEAVQLSQQKDIPESVIQSLSESSALGYLLGAALRKKGAGRERLSTIMEEEGQVVSYQLGRFLTTLGTIAAISPLLGLLGTVFGMIEIFASQSPEGSDPRALANGISIALYNTAMGLIVAIPSMIFYRYFRSRVEGLLVMLEIKVNQFLDILDGEHVSVEQPPLEDDKD